MTIYIHFKVVATHLKNLRMQMSDAHSSKVQPVLSGGNSSTTAPKWDDIFFWEGSVQSLRRHAFAVTCSAEAVRSTAWQRVTGCAMQLALVLSSTVHGEGFLQEIGRE
jgi:hypothetical protein